MSFGIALLIAGLFFLDGRASSKMQAMPTPDRLAEPTLPPVPSQADHGAQVYWLSCLPCHGDKGQGLTDEFRQTYPPEDQYCWERGCHGDFPYENGFTIPKFIPGVIGPGTIENKFTDAAQLENFIKVAMPYWRPGSLTEEEAWNVTAFLLRENGLWGNEKELNISNASGVNILGVPTLSMVTEQAQVEKRNGGSSKLFLAGILVVSTILFFVLKQNLKQDYNSGH